MHDMLPFPVQTTEWFQTGLFPPVVAAWSGAKCVVSEFGPDRDRIDDVNSVIHNPVAMQGLPDDSSMIR